MTKKIQVTTPIVFMLELSFQQQQRRLLKKLMGFILDGEGLGNK